MECQKKPNLVSKETCQKRPNLTLTLSKQLNKEIFETIYFGALTASIELAKVHGSYDTFAGKH
jgi:hypothetical protein